MRERFRSRIHEYILVTVWTVDAATVAVDAQIERGAVLNHGFVEAREKHMWLVAHPFHGITSSPCCLRVLHPTREVQW